jgi:hypothetical protein
MRQGVLAGRPSGCARADAFGGEAASVTLTSVNLVMRRGVGEAARLCGGGCEFEYSWLFKPSTL